MRPQEFKHTAIELDMFTVKSNAIKILVFNQKVLNLIQIYIYIGILLKMCPMLSNVQVYFINLGIYK